MATSPVTGSSCFVGCRYVDQAYARRDEFKEQLHRKCDENKSLTYTNGSLRKDVSRLTKELDECRSKAEKYDKVKELLFREKEKTREQEEENAVLKARLRQLEKDESDSYRWRTEDREKIKELESELDKVKAELGEANDEREKLREENSKAKNEIARLKSILNNNPANTSTPPSKGEPGVDPHSHRKKQNEFNDRDAAKQKAGEDAPKKSRGGQPEREGTTLTREDVEKFMEENEGKFVHEIHEIGTKADGKPYRVRYTIGTEVKVVIKEYRYYEDAVMPPEHHSNVTYDSSLKALAAYLYGECNMPTDKIKDLFSVISDGLINISEGSAYNFCREVAGKCAASIEQLCTDLLNGEVLYTDATNTRENGKQTYVRNASNENTVVYSPQDSKTIEEIGNTAVLKDFLGIIMADHEVALKHFGDEIGAECNQHGGRYCLKNYEQTGHSWSMEFMDLLYEIKDKKAEYMKQGINAFSEEELNGYSKRYDEKLKDGWKQDEEDKNLYEYARKDEQSLLRRFEKFKAEHLMFATNFKVEFTNNRSESDVRCFKQRTKATGGFRQKSGRKICCDLMSVIRTCKKRVMPVYETLKMIAATSINVFAKVNA